LKRTDTEELAADPGLRLCSRLEALLSDRRTPFTQRRRVPRRERGSQLQAPLGVRLRPHRYCGTGATRWGAQMMNSRWDSASLLSRRAADAGARQLKRLRIVVSYALFGFAATLGVAEGSTASDAVPPFKVSAQNANEVALLVDKHVTRAQLKTPVLALRKARQENQLGRLIAPTTPRGSRGPYAIVVVYVYSDPEWATPDALRRGNQASFGTPSFDKCSASVRAHYFWVYADSSGCRAELMGGISARGAAKRARASAHSCARTAAVS
jgi:hypothetical protein